MIFGNRNDFAIEAMVEPDLAPPSRPWGRLCVWVAGHRIGNYDEPHCGLGGPCAHFKETCGELNDLWDDEFANMADVELWNFLDGLLYGYHGNVELDDDLRSMDEILQDSSRYSKFNFLTNWGEMFDRGGKSFILKQPGGMLKVLNFDYEKNSANAYVCSEFSFRLAIKDFAAWYDGQLIVLNSEENA
jgi:hypothetical protein